MKHCDFTVGLRVCRGKIAEKEACRKHIYQRFTRNEWNKNRLCAKIGLAVMTNEKEVFRRLASEQQAYLNIPDFMNLFDTCYFVVIIHAVLECVGE